MMPVVSVVLYYILSIITSGLVAFIVYNGARNRALSVADAAAIVAIIVTIVIALTTERSIILLGGFGLIGMLLGIWLWILPWLLKSYMYTFIGGFILTIIVFTSGIIFQSGTKEIIIDSTENHNIPIDGQVCKPKQEFQALYGKRMFLNSKWFNILEQEGASIGTKITLQVTIDGVPTSVSGLILDHDSTMVDCDIAIDSATRSGLNRKLDSDVNSELGKRPIRQFKVIF